MTVNGRGSVPRSVKLKVHKVRVQARVHFQPNVFQSIAYRMMKCVCGRRRNSQTSARTARARTSSPAPARKLHASYPQNQRPTRILKWIIYVIVLIVLALRRSAPASNLAHLSLHASSYILNRKHPSPNCSFARLQRITRKRVERARVACLWRRKLCRRRPDCNQHHERTSALSEIIANWRLSRKKSY